MFKNQPPAWAIQEAKDRLDSEEYSKTEIAELARQIASESTGDN